LSINNSQILLQLQMNSDDYGEDVVLYEAKKVIDS